MILWLHHYFEVVFHLFAMLSFHFLQLLLSLVHDSSIPLYPHQVAVIKGLKNQIVIVSKVDQFSTLDDFVALESGLLGSQVSLNMHVEVILVDETKSFP
jgi:hypothetical protein